MVCIAIRAMSTILILISVTNKIEDKDRVIISTLLACLLITYLDTMGGKRGTQDVTSLQLLSWKTRRYYRDTLMTWKEAKFMFWATSGAPWHSLGKSKKCFYN